MGTRLLGYILIGGSLLLGAVVLYLNSAWSNVPLVFSPVQMQNALWNQYKKEYLEEGTLRTLDKQRQFITTSEGQSYTILRAVWLGDKSTFDTSWQWTKDNLDRPNDRLFSWLFGKRSDGTWGILDEQGGANTASDADQDIALALIFAYARWQDPMYLGDARAILNDLWEQEVLMIGNKPYLMANNFEKFSNESTAVMNPSYLAPYAYRIFAQVDKTRPWEALVDTSYEVIERSTESNFGTQSAGLPPDWVRIHKQTGALSAPGEDLTTNFGYDALRVPWRLALDWQWYGEERAKEALEKMDFLAEEWKERKTLGTTYSHSGAAIAPYETPAMYGGSIGYFTVTDETLAREVYEQKLQYLFDPGTNRWREVLSYYDDNWAWFGLSLYHKLLPNLAASIPETAFNR